jgi:hypothetical protein
MAVIVQPGSASGSVIVSAPPAVASGFTPVPSAIVVPVGPAIEADHAVPIEPAVDSVPSRPERVAEFGLLATTSTIGLEFADHVAREYWWLGALAGLWVGTRLWKRWG